MSEAKILEAAAEEEVALTREELKALYERRQQRPPMFGTPQEDIVGRLEALGLNEYALQLDHKGYQHHVPDEMLKRRSARFARILGAKDPMGWSAEGPDFRGHARYAERTRETRTTS